MLKWTASAQKIMQESAAASTAAAALRTPLERQRRPRCQRRVTIANNNKENIMPLASYATSTPMTVGRASLGQRTRNSPLVLAPLADIRNVTPEPTAATMASMATPHSDRRRRQSLPQLNEPQQQQQQRPRIMAEHVYAATLPRFEEEEYSPSAAPLLPSGQHLALRGLLPLPLQLDPFMGNQRYFTTPDVQHGQAQAKRRQLALPKKRKLEQEFAAIVAQEQHEQQLAKQQPPKANNNNNTKLQATPPPPPPPTTTTRLNTTCFSSVKMGDQTLDKLIDAILDSACKEEKKQKKSRKSFNLRRRTLLKNQQMDALHEQAMLSPSYAAGDDPASDLSFLLCEPKMLATPSPATPLPGTPLTRHVLACMPTPTPMPMRLDGNVSKSNTFTLATPVRPLAHKRRRRAAAQTQTANVGVAVDVDVGAIASPVKKFKVDASNYFEIGLALPSIYV